MLSLLVVFSSFFQCFVDAVHESSKYHITKGKDYKKTRVLEFHKHRPTKRKDVEKFVRYIWEGADTDVRVLALSWVESRLRLNISRGDKGKACGTFQIHARHSYPLFHRKRGYVGWEESENTLEIQKECRKLEKLSYSIDTLNRLLTMMDKKDLHICHHNSGFYGKCSSFYKHRVDYWVTYYSIAKNFCEERELFMAMIKTGAPSLAVPLEKIQGYVDSIKEKEAQSDSALYMEGYNKGAKVRSGEEEAPPWAPAV